MKLKIKKYIYFINDITNTLLEKNRVEDHKLAQSLRRALIIVSIALSISLILNILFLIKFI